MKNFLPLPSPVKLVNAFFKKYNKRKNQLFVKTERESFNSIINADLDVIFSLSIHFSLLLTLKKGNVSNSNFKIEFINRCYMDCM